MGANEHKKNTWEEKFQIEGKFDDDGSFSEYRKETLYEPTYVTASQGKILINGMLIDECYDIQYNYREFKEPIYGYNSKHFDAILPGTVIIHGAFTINYKHDGYLHAALHAASGILNNNGPSSRNQAIHRREKLKKDQKLYRESLQSLREEQENKKDLVISKQGYEQDIKDAQSLLSTLKEKEQMYCKNGGILESNLSSAQKNFEDYVNSLSEGELRNIREALEKIDDIKAKSDASNNLIEEYSNKLQAKKDSIQESADKERAELEVLEAQIDTLEQRKINLLALNNNEDSVFNEILQIEEDLADLRPIVEEYLTSIYNWELDLEAVNQEIKNQESASRDAIVQQDQMIQSQVQWSDTIKRYVELQQKVEVAKINLRDGKASIKKEVMDQDEKVRKAEKLLAIINLEATGINEKINMLIKAVNSFKSKIDEINKSVISDMEMGDRYISKAWQRAEDHEDFNIFIEYNGDVHKALMHCQLTGHSHVLSHSGQPVKEYYTFIAREINTDYK